MEKQGQKHAVLTIVTGFIFLGLLLHKIQLVWFAALVGLGALASSHIEHGIVWVWMKIATVLGAINSRILLGVTFYAILVPISFLKRLFSKTDAMKLKKPQSSVWTTRGHTYTKADLENTF